jgi:ADP-ribose pyrophosphatase
LVPRQFDCQGFELQSAKFIRAAGKSVPKNETIHYFGRFLGLKETDGWEYAFRTNASGVIVLVPVTDEGELVLVEQYRVPVKSRVIELPAGLVGDNGDTDEDFKTAARRELFEETGYQADSLEELLTSPSTAGMADETLNFYFASGLQRTGPGGGDASEDITVHLVPLHEATAWLEARQAEGIMIDHKVYAGLFWAKSRS